MKIISGKQMCRALERHGWALDRINGSSHIDTHPANPNSIPVPVHGNQDLRRGTQRTIMRLAGLTDADL